MHLVKFFYSYSGEPGKGDFISHIPQKRIVFKFLYILINRKISIHRFMTQRLLGLKTHFQKETFDKVPIPITAQ